MGFCNIGRSVACMMLMVVLSTVHGQPVQPTSSDAYCPADHLESQLASIEYRLIDIQKMVSTPKKPLNKVSCTVDLASYGSDDSTKDGYVKTSGGSSEDVLVLDGSGNPRSLQLGVTIMELDPKTCTTRNRQRFSTHSVPGERAFLLDSLEYKTTGTIIVGVTVDTAENEDNMALRNVVGSFFTRYNMDLSGFGFRGKFVFIMQKGYPRKSIFQSKPRYGPSLKMRVALNGSTIDDVTFKRV